MAEENNLTVTMKPGETGFTIVATFKDADNKPIDLTDYTATILIATKRHDGVDRSIVINEAMTKYANQTTTGKGTAKYSFTEQQAADIAKATYVIEGVLTRTGETQKFPKQPGRSLGELVVTDTIQI